VVVRDLYGAGLTWAALRKSGVSEEQITTMLVDTPRRFFETSALGPY
jgi:predicted metal-dependent phosphotriesterase family hydrolase